MKPTPRGWPRLSSAVYYKDAAAAIDWLCEAFGFEIRLRIEGEGGRIEHSELVFGEALIFVSDEARQGEQNRAGRSPRAVGGANTQSIMIFVDDVDAHCAHARAAGATISVEPKVSDYGEDYWTDKSYQCEDLDGHQWWFTQRLRDPT